VPAAAFDAPSTCFVAHPLLVAGFAQPPAIVGGAAVLPDDRGRDGLERAPVPQHERFSLVGDADRAHMACRHACRPQSLSRARLHRRPDLVGVVLDPARPGVMLRDLGVALAENIAGLITGANYDRGSAGRAFVQAQDDWDDVRFQTRLRLPVE